MRPGHARRAPPIVSTTLRISTIPFIASRRRRSARVPRTGRADRPDRVASGDQRPDVRRAAESLGQASGRASSHTATARGTGASGCADRRRASAGGDDPRSAGSGSAGPIDRTAARSRARNPASPSSVKISGIGRPASTSMSRQGRRTMRRGDARRARPTALLPLPGSPTSTRSIGRPQSSPPEPTSSAVRTSSLRPPGPPPPRRRPPASAPRERARAALDSARRCRPSRRANRHRTCRERSRPG